MLIILFCLFGFVWIDADFVGLKLPVQDSDLLLKVFFLNKMIAFEILKLFPQVPFILNQRLDLLGLLT